MPKRLIFVYNADDSFLSMATDFIHKIVKPETYQCSLCALTYGNVSMKKEWKSFLDSLNFDVEFIYKTAFQNKSKFSGIPVPCIVLVENDTQNVLIEATEMNSLSSLEELIRVLEAKLYTKS